MGKMPPTITPKKWLIIQSCWLAFWTMVLTASVTMSFYHTRLCEKYNRFGQFGMVISTYMLLLYLVDTIIAGVALYSQRRQESVQEEIDKRKLVTNEKDFTPNDKVIIEVMCMDRERKLMDRIAEKPKKKTRGGGEDLSNDKLAEIVTKTFNDSDFILADTTTNLKLNNLLACNTTQGVGLTSTYGTVFTAAVNGLPVMSLCFFLIVGVDTLGTIRDYQNSIGKSDEPINRFCYAYYTFNWSIVVVCFLVSLFRTIPPLVHICRQILINAAKKKEKTRFDDNLLK